VYMKTYTYKCVTHIHTESDTYKYVYVNVYEKIFSRNCLEDVFVSTF